MDEISVFLVAEEVRDPADEGYDRVTLELAEALGRRARVRLHLTPPVTARGPWGRAWRGSRRMLAFADPRLHLELRRSRPDLVVYLSQSSMTTAALARGRLLKLTAGARPLLMIALQPKRLGRFRFLAARVLPDLLLVATQDQLEDASRLGASVARFGIGVDLERFRPASAGERMQLRRAWDVPEEASVILHVGHLTQGRNLEALLPLAVRPDRLVIVAASSHVTPDSAALSDTLRGAGVRVYHGHLQRIEELYRLADCYVFPTLSSDHAIGFPLSVLEAMASDLPVASTSFGALPERFPTAAGVRFVDDPADLSKAVDELLSKVASTRVLAEPYSWDAVARHVLTGAKR